LIQNIIHKEGIQNLDAFFITFDFKFVLNLLQDKTVL